jgi:hypothetical protein
MRNKKVLVFSIITLALVMSACTPAAATPAMTEVMTQPAMTEAMTQPAMTEAMTEAAMTPAMTEPAMTEPAMTEAMTQDAMMQGADSVAVSDQKLGSDNSLVIDKVVASVDGWIVIHADANGKPGMVLGHAAVKKGENDKVKVVLDDTKDLGGAVWAMLHIDAGTIGTYEFSGPDAPVKDSGANIVMLSFKVTR